MVEGLLSRSLGWTRIIALDTALSAGHIGLFLLIHHIVAPGLGLLLFLLPLNKIVPHRLLLPGIPNGSNFTRHHLCNNTNQNSLGLRILNLNSKLLSKRSPTDVIISVDLFFEDVQGMLEFETL